MPGLSTRTARAVGTYWPMMLASAVVSAIAWPQLSSAFDGTAGAARIMLAQKEDPKKKKEQGKPQPKQQPQQQPQPKPAPKQVQPQQQPQQQPQPKPVPKQVQPQQQPQPVPKQVQPQQPQPKLAPKQVQPQERPGARPQPKMVQPPQQPGAPQPKVVQPPQRPGAPQQPGVQQPQVVQPPQRPGLPQQQPQVVQPKGAPPNARFGQPQAAPGPRFGNVNELKGKRQQTKDPSGRVVIVEPDNRRIVRDKNRVVIFHDDSARMRRFGNARFEVRGQERYTTVRRGDFEVVTITDANGRLLRRFRRGPDGREYVLIDNRRRGVRPGVVVGVAGLALLGLAAPAIPMPREHYIVNGAGAPPALLYEALDAPPIAPLERAYTLDEIRDNVELRAYVRSVDVNTINFESGSWELSPDQIPQLQALAEAMMRVISEKPDTVFMIEGHTDAVGAPEDNLSLSDRRAETISEVLTSEFQVPPENMVTQGYGEQYLLVQTDGPSRENRRVQVRNITTLLAGR